MTALVLTGNQIAEREDEVATLKHEDAAAAARGRSSSPPTPSSATLSEQRVATVSSLADSRFDWERVMRELSLVLPGDVWLVSLTATASPSRRSTAVAGAAEAACAARSRARRWN